jgi:hypothetical protein
MQLIILPCSFTRRNAGINIAINTAIIAITTKSSINVNPLLLRLPIITLLSFLLILTSTFFFYDAQEQQTVPQVDHFALNKPDFTERFIIT